MATHLENVSSTFMAILRVWAHDAKCGVLVRDFYMSLCGIIYGIQGQWLGAGISFRTWSSCFLVYLFVVCFYSATAAQHHRSSRLHSVRVLQDTAAVLLLNTLCV
jgi:hypothetical protein